MMKGKTKKCHKIRVGSCTQSKCQTIRTIAPKRKETRKCTKEETGSEFSTIDNYCCCCC